MRGDNGVGVGMGIALEAFGIAAVGSLLLAQVCMSVAVRFHWVDRPGHRKIHRKPVPYLGGLAIFLGTSLSLGVLALLDPTLGSSGLAVLLACFLPALGAMAVGLWDDISDLRPRLKFALQAALALAFSWYGYSFTTIHIPGFEAVMLGHTLSALLTAFVIVGLANGYNMMDGSDGLLVGGSASTLLVLALAARWQGQAPLEILALAGAGGCVGALVWNLPPARIYMGDAGSQGLGFLVACSLVALGKSAPGRFWDNAFSELNEPFSYKVLLVGIFAGWPALEVLLTVARRSLQCKRLGVADQGHLHHRLRRLGVGPLGIALTAVLVNLLCAGSVLALMEDQRGLFTLLILPLAVVLGFGLQRLGYTRFFRREWLEERRPHFAVATHFAAMQGAKLKLARDPSEVLVLVAQTCLEFGVSACRVSYSAGSRRQTWTWSDPDHDPKRPQYRDRVRLHGARVHAFWSADAQDDREPELGMNLRVVMVDFMRRALERLGTLSGAYPAPESALPAAKLHQTMSIKSLKQRL